MMFRCRSLGRVALSAVVFTGLVRHADASSEVWPSTTYDYDAVPGTRLVAHASDAAQIIGGLTEAFLQGEHGALSPSEADCLSKGASKLAGGVLDTAGRTAQTFDLFFNQAHGSTLEANRAAVAAGVPINPSSTNAVDPLIAGIEITQRISSMLEFERQISKKCLKEDATAELEAASDHFTNITFLGSRLLANGVDIVTEMGKAAAAFDNGDYDVFGENVGLAARKVLLSKRGEGIAKLVHEPTAEEVEEMTSGLIGSLFGVGTSMQITTDAVTTWAPPPANYFQPVAVQGPNGTTVYQTPEVPAMIPWTLLPATEVDVDLHQCITSNKELFQSAFAPMAGAMNAITSTAKEGHTLEKATTAKEGHTLEKTTEMGAKGFGVLAMSMLDMQIALRRCGFTAEQEAILWEVVESGNGAHALFEAPDQHELTKHEIEANVQDAVEAWEQRRYKAFGKRLGVMFRESLTKSFPEKYYVDESGGLRKHLLQLAEQQGATDPARTATRLPGTVLAIVGCACMFVGLILLRTRRSFYYDQVQTEALSSSNLV